MRRLLAVALAALSSIGCHNTIAARRPLSDSTLAEINQTIEGRTPKIVLNGEGKSAPASPAVIELACETSGRATVRLGESCTVTENCACGLTCETTLDSMGAVCIGPSSAKVEPEIRHLQVGRDTTSWVEVWPSSQAFSRTVPTAALQQISFRGAGRGVFAGFGLGLLLGAAGGALIGSATAPGGNCNDNAGCLYPFIGAVLGAAIGPWIGMVVAGAIGDLTTIQFDPVNP